MLVLAAGADPAAEDEQYGKCGGQWAYDVAVEPGLGRIVALCHRSSTLHQIH